MEAAEEELLLSGEEEGDSAGQRDNLDANCGEVEVDVATSEEQGNGTFLRFFPEGVRRKWERLVSSCWALQRRNWFLMETILLLKLAFPMFFQYSFQQSLFFITLLFLGQYGQPLELSAASLGITVVNVTAFSTIAGLASAAETLGPQSYGVKNYKRVGVILQRGLLIISWASLPIIAVWLNAEPIMLVLKQQPCIIPLTAKFLKVFILALPALITYITLRKYLQASSQVWMFLVAGFVTNVFVLVWCSVFIIAIGIGIVGASLSIGLAWWMGPICLLFYIKFHKHPHQTWGGWSFESLTEWWQFVRLGIFGFLSVAFEWWSFEIGSLVVGSIGEVQLAVNTILQQFSTMLYMIPHSLATALTVRVGNELGAANPRSAKRASYIGFGVSIAVGTLICAVLLIFRYQVGRVFSPRLEVIKGVGDTMFGAIGVFFFDQVQGLVSGIMLATGRQASNAIVSFFCYNLIGLPLGITLALVAGLEVKGMWIGLSVADGIQTVILTSIFIATNWKKQSEKAIHNAGGVVEHEGKSAGTDEPSTVNMELQETTPSGIQDSGIELAEIDQEDENGEVETALLEDTTETLGAEHSSDSSSMLPHGRATLYTSSSRLCQTKTSILISKGAILLGGVALLLAGGVVALTVSSHVLIPCDTNCSVVCQSSPFPTPTPTHHGPSEGRTTPPFDIAPTPTPSPINGSQIGSMNDITLSIFTTSPLHVTSVEDVHSNSSTCDCSEYN